MPIRMRAIDVATIQITTDDRVTFGVYYLTMGCNFGERSKLRAANLVQSMGLLYL